MTVIIPPESSDSQEISIEKLKKLPIWLASNPDKKPISAITGNIARWSNREELATFEQTQRFINGRIGFLPAFVLYKEQQLVFIDLDHCYDDSNTLKPFAKKILEKTGRSFAEKSRSGKGLHILVRGQMPQAGINTPDIEMYSDKKIVTLTFDYVDGREELENHQELINQLIEEHGPKKEEASQEEDAPPIMETSQVIEKVKALSHYKILFENGFTSALQEHYKKDHSTATSL